MKVTFKRSAMGCRTYEDSYIEIRQLLIVGIVCISAVATTAYPIPSNKPSNFPGWWFTQGVIVPTNPTNSAPTWPGDYPTSDDYAVANEGQLKNFATQALSELQTALPGSVWSTTQGTNLIASINTLGATNTDDYAAMNLGQIKTVAKPFYDVLLELGYVTDYPWTGSSPDDFMAGNIGQVKEVFSFPILPSPNGLTVVFSGTQAVLSWSDATSNLQSFTIEESMNGGITWTTIETVAGSTTSATIADLIENGNYVFKVMGVSSAGTSSPSASDSAPTINLITPSDATSVP